MTWRPTGLPVTSSITAAGDDEATNTSKLAVAKSDVETLIIGRSPNHAIIMCSSPLDPAIFRPYALASTCMAWLNAAAMGR
jgi:hypothetical protein